VRDPKQSNAKKKRLDKERSVGGARRGEPGQTPQNLSEKKKKKKKRKKKKQ